jgi:8-oxo-dGTP diphosphatase
MKENATIHVMAGVLCDPQGRVLLAERPAGKHLAGFWEFPGGKLEAGEPPWHGLRRELREELGVEARGGEPLIRVPWRYGERSLLLDTWRIDTWLGEPASLEGQALQWREPARVDAAIMAPADRVILNALRLPSRYPITPAEPSIEEAGAWRARLEAALRGGARLLQLRFPRWPAGAVRELAAALLPLARRLDAQLMLNGDIEGALRLGPGVGVQLKAAQLDALAARPLPLSQRVGASCHDAAQLARACALDADFACLSPVAPTASHPGVAPMGWAAFHDLAKAASLPVYALGGMRPGDEARAREAGGQGVAGIRGFW